MKTVWMRVGMTVEVTDEQYEELRKEALNETYTKAYGFNRYDDLEAPSWLLDRIEKYGELDGDSYIPETEWD